MVQEELEHLCKEIEAAFVFAYPLFAFAETRFQAAQDNVPDRHDANTIRHDRALCDHLSHWITSPNNDTLYSNAWLDLSHGPVQIRAPKMPEGHYWSLALMDAFTNHITVIGQRTDGRGPVEFNIVGPGHSDDMPGRVVRAPGLDAWLFCRCLVDGPASAPLTYALQDGITVTPRDPGQGEPRIIPKRPITPNNFLEVVNELLARNPVPTSETALLAGWERLGLRAGGKGTFAELPDDIRAAWQQTIQPAYEALAAAGQAGRRNFDGWIAAAEDIGNFGSNYPLRASVALGGLGALEPIEAMYFVKYKDQDDTPLTGTRDFILTIPPGGIPTGSFWSFTMYSYTSEGKRVLVGNPIDRYSIGNRTPGLVYETDGSLQITLSHGLPADEKGQANWLPSPAGGFHIALRTYLPSLALREGRVALPTIRRMANRSQPD